MLRSFTFALAAVALLGAAAPGVAAAGEFAVPGLIQAQSAALGLDTGNDKLALGTAHLICREAVIAATTPAMPWSDSRRAARVAYAGLDESLSANAARADALLIEGLRESGRTEASAETITRLGDRIRKGLASRLFQVNPGTAAEMAVSCRTLAAANFDSLPAQVAAR